MNNAEDQLNNKVRLGGWSNLGKKGDLVGNGKGANLWLDDSKTHPKASK